MDALFAKFRSQFMGRVMVNQISLNHSLTVSIFIYRLSKNLGGLQGRRRCQCNFYRLKIFHNRAIFALIINLVPIENFIFSHFFIQNVSSVRFINNHQIKICNRWHSFLGIVENAFYHTLHSGHLNAGFTVNFLLFQSFYIINIIQGH